MFRRLIGGAVILGAAAAGAYAAAVRPWHLRWGASDEEVVARMPGDDLILLPRVRATHAVTIRARAADVWPWLMQIGNGRGGFYSYDWLENAAGLDIHSADTLLPEFGELKVGDKVPLAPGTDMTVVEIDPPSKLVLRATLDPRTGASVDRNDPDADMWMDATWAFLLDESGEPDPWATRLVTRFRVDYAPNPWTHVAAWAALEPMHFAMERQMLLGIKERAERRREPQAVASA